MTKNEIPELVAFIGLDWADDKHDISLVEAAGTTRVERRQLPQIPEAIHEWVAEMRGRFPGGRVGICLELSRGPLIYALIQHDDFIVLYPVNPKSLKRFRETFAPNGSKDDPADADLLRELLQKHRDRLHPWLADTPEIRSLRRLTEDRRNAVDLRTSLTQALRAALKGYFPQVLGLVGDLTSRLACDFLLKWPTLEALQRSHPKTVRQFYYAHGSRRGDLIEERLEKIRNAVPLTRDAAIVETSVLTVQMLARQIRVLQPSIARYEEEIAKIFAAHPDAELFNRLPGAGDALAPRLLAAFGSDRDRFQSAQDIQNLVGIAPVTVRSGKSSHVRWRWGAPKFMRQSFHEFARQSIHHSAWARAFYQLQRERGKKHHAAIRSLAFKWARILYRCWSTRTPYDEHRYIQALQRRGSPLAARLQLPAAA